MIFFAAVSLHLPRPEPRVKKLPDQGLGRGFNLPAAKDGTHDGRTQGKSLDPLGRPIRAQFIAGYTPDFFRVRPEEHLKKTMTEAIRHPGRKRRFRFDRQHLGF